MGSCVNSCLNGIEIAIYFSASSSLLVMEISTQIGELILSSLRRIIILQVSHLVTLELCLTDP